MSWIDPTRLVATVWSTGRRFARIRVASHKSCQELDFSTPQSAPPDASTRSDPCCQLLRRLTMEACPHRRRRGRRRSWRPGPLVGATAIWGSTFLVTKQSLPEMSPASFLVWRFGLAAIALLVARPRQLVTLTRAELHRGRSRESLVMPHVLEHQGPWRVRCNKDSCLSEANRMSCQGCP
jgi:hypothetical protein